MSGAIQILNLRVLGLWTVMYQRIIYSVYTDAHESYSSLPFDILREDRSIFLRP